MSEWMSECSFDVSYSNGDWICSSASFDLNVGFEYEFVVNCGGLQSQTIPLSAGTNWVSFNVETTLDDLKAALVDALPGSTSINIRSQNSGYSTYNGTRWRGSLNSIDLTQMYMVTVNAPCEIALEGMPIDPDGLPITIKSGNNWMAFPIATSMTLSEAFAGFTVTTGDVIKSQNNGMATYNGTRWRGSLSVLEAGQGYIYNSAATGDKTLVFPTTAK